MGNISPFTEHGLEILPLIFSVFCELLPFHIQQNNFIKLFGSIRFNPLPFEIISRITIHLSHVPSNERDDFQYQYVDIRAEGITKEDLQQKAGKPVETVPQIFVDQQHIGGYTDFAAWVKENLDA